MLLADHRPNLLRLAVERLVVTGREGVRAEHDPPLRLVPEAFASRALVHGANVPVLHPEAIAHAVVAREVGGRLGGGDQVVAGQTELDRARQGALAALRAQLAR